jgi:hypothetical protein
MSTTSLKINRICTYMRFTRIAMLPLVMFDQNCSKDYMYSPA